MRLIVFWSLTSLSNRRRVSISLSGLFSWMYFRRAVSPPSVSRSTSCVWCTCQAHLPRVVIGLYQAPEVFKGSEPGHHGQHLLDAHELQELRLLNIPTVAVFERLAPSSACVSQSTRLKPIGFLPNVVSQPTGIEWLFPNMPTSFRLVEHVNDVRIARSQNGDSGRHVVAQL